MIKGFLFEDFKGFQKAELFLEDISILIGANASGKSNAIEGIAILSEIAAGRDFAAILDGTRNSESFVRGGSQRCCRFQSTSFTLGCLIDLDEENDLLYRIRIKVQDQVSLDSESLFIVPNGCMSTADAGDRIFSTEPLEEERSKLIQVSIRHDRQGADLLLNCARDTAVLHQLKNQPSEENSIMVVNLQCIHTVLENLKKILILSPKIGVMGNYCRIGDKRLKYDASNLSAALYELCGDAVRRQSMLEIIRQLPENEIRDLGFLIPGNGDVLFYLEENNMSSSGKIYANQLSAGTLRAIAVITALLQEPKGSLVIIDEVDNGLHPARAKALLSWMISINHERNVDILITTHNVSLLNSVKGETVLGVSVAYRDPEKGDARMVPFVDLDSSSYILATGGIGTAEENDQLLTERGIQGTLPVWLEA